MFYVFASCSIAAQNCCCSSLVQLNSNLNCQFSVFNDRFLIAKHSATLDRGQLHNASTHCPVLQIKFESRQLSQYRQMISTGHGVRFQAGAVFSLLRSVQTALVPTQRPVQLNVLWELSGSDEELNAWSYAPILQVLLNFCQIKHKQNFSFLKIATPCSLVWGGQRFGGTQAPIFRL